MQKIVRSLFTILPILGIIIGVNSQYDNYHYSEYPGDPYSPYTKHAPAVPVHTVIKVKEDDYDVHPKYNYGYSVVDTLTGDSKTASEVRDGQLVKGQYSLVDADGYLRVVSYTSDPINGFNAKVDRKPIVVHKVPVPVVKPIYKPHPIPVKHHPIPAKIKNPYLAYYPSPAKHYSYVH